MTNSCISIPLDLPDVGVLDTRFSSTGRLIITFERPRCRKGGRVVRRFHGYDDRITPHHPAILGRRVYARFRPKRCKCPGCEDRPTTTQQVCWHGPNKPNTKAYKAQVLLALVNTTIQDLATKEAVAYNAVLGIVERQIATRVDRDQYTHLYMLGLDAIALKKAHQEFVVIITARLRDQRIALRGC